MGGEHGVEVGIQALSDRGFLWPGVALGQCLRADIRKGLDLVSITETLRNLPTHVLTFSLRTFFSKAVSEDDTGSDILSTGRLMNASCCVSVLMFKA